MSGKIKQYNKRVLASSLAGTGAGSNILNWLNNTETEVNFSPPLPVNKIFLFPPHAHGLVWAL